MKRSDAFPSPWLKADDVSGVGEMYTMDKVAMVELDDRENGGKIAKPALYFRGEEKALLLNATNWDRIVDQHGPDSDKWAGKKVKLHLEAITAFNKTSDCIRVALK